jgi:hypothetical protein
VPQLSIGVLTADLLRLGEELQALNRRRARAHRRDGRSVCRQAASLGVDLIVTASAVYDGIAPAENARDPRSRETGAWSRQWPD